MKSKVDDRQTEKQKGQNEEPGCERTKWDDEGKETKKENQWKLKVKKTTKNENQFAM